MLFSLELVELGTPSIAFCGSRGQRRLCAVRAARAAERGTRRLEPATRATAGTFRCLFHGSRLTTRASCVPSCGCGNQDTPFTFRSSREQTHLQRRLTNIGDACYLGASNDPQLERNET